MKKISEQQLNMLQKIEKYGATKDKFGFCHKTNSGYIPTATANSLIKRGLVSVAPDGTCAVTEQGKQYCDN
jgi:hypothetical protein